MPLTLKLPNCAGGGLVARPKGEVKDCRLVALRMDQAKLVTPLMIWLVPITLNDWPPFV